MRQEILTILSSEGLQRGSAGSYSPAPCRGALKGAILPRERMAPFRSPKRTQGALPLDPAHWQFVARRTARAAQSKCGVHGFAMNPYYSLPVATAPYYREARVTFSRRQTACGMRHCCARRIVGTGDRRKLLCTPTRWAERQRIIGAGQIVYQHQTRQRRDQGSAIGKHCSSSSCSLAM